MKWKLSDGREINLLTPIELGNLSGDTKIISILGDERLVDEYGLEPPDGDTRGGWTAWGILINQDTEEEKKSEFGSI